MRGFLDQVIAQKRVELAGKKRSRPGEALRETAAARAVRDFRGALQGGGRIIAEIKQKSPTVPAFPQRLAPVELAEVYAANGAAALSIVTDTPNFGTSLADVERVRGVVPLPVLVKDFVIDDYQILEARAAGADAVLLIARILPAGEFAALLDRVRSWGMCALAECHDGADIDKAIGAGATIVGINNRDLGTLRTSVETTRDLIALIPPGVLKVSESGIDRPDQIAGLAALGVDAFLIGGSLLSARDPGLKLRELRGGGGGDG